MVLAQLGCGGASQRASARTSLEVWRRSVYAALPGQRQLKKGMRAALPREPSPARDPGRLRRRSKCSGDTAARCRAKRRKKRAASAPKRPPTSTPTTPTAAPRNRIRAGALPPCGPIQAKAARCHHALQGLARGAPRRPERGRGWRAVSRTKTAPWAASAARKPRPPKRRGSCSTRHAAGGMGAPSSPYRSRTEQL